MLASLTSCLSFFTFFCFNHIVSKSSEMRAITLLSRSGVMAERTCRGLCVCVSLFSVKGRGLKGGRGLVWSVGTAKGGKFGTDCYLALPGWWWEPSTHQPRRVSRCLNWIYRQRKQIKHTKKKASNTSVITVTGASWVPTPNPLFLLFFRFIFFLSLLLFLFLLCFSPSERTHWSVFPCFSSFCFFATAFKSFMFPPLSLPYFSHTCDYLRPVDFSVPHDCSICSFAVCIYSYYSYYFLSFIFIIF